MKKQHITFSPSQTQKIARTLARDILKAGLSKTPIVIGLEGDLGSGKTTFIQGFAKGMGIKEKILSPTFVLLKKFQVFHPPNFCFTRVGRARVPSFKFQDFYHIDCYRIENPKEILDLGFKEIISNPKNIIIIEWADRIKKIMPGNAIWIKFDFEDGAKRKIVVE